MYVISSKVAANDICVPTARDKYTNTQRLVFNRLKWPLPGRVPQFIVCVDVFEQQYTSCMKVGSVGNLGLSREYPKKLFGPMFYSWWNCPLIKCKVLNSDQHYSSTSRPREQGPGHPGLQGGP